MILAIDVGNTNIVLGLVDNGQVGSVAPRVSTNLKKTDFEYAALFRDVLEYTGVDVKSIDGAILSSVVWPITSTL